MNFRPSVFCYESDAWIFDLDGTLVDSHHAIKKHLVDVFEDFGLPPYSEIETRKLLGSSLEKIIANLGVFGEIKEQVISEFRIRLNNSLAESHPIFPGAILLLGNLKKKGAKIAVATNKPTEIAERVVSETQLGSYVDVVIGSTDNPPKPDPYILIKCIELLDSRRPLMVGDSEEDRIAAVELGIGFVGINSSNSFSKRIATDREAYFKSINEILKSLF